MDRNALAQIIQASMRPDNPGPQPGLPTVNRYLPQDWMQEGPGQWVPPGSMPPMDAPLTDAMPEHGPMGPPGPPMGFPLEGRTRMGSVPGNDFMQGLPPPSGAPSGPMPGGPGYMEPPAGVQRVPSYGEREVLPPRRYGPGQPI